MGVIERVERGDGGSPYYMGKVSLKEHAPEMAEAIAASPKTPLALYGSCFGKTQEAHTYFGCGKNTTTIHCDAEDNLLLVICGTKTFDLYPPSDAENLYPCGFVEF